MKRKITAKLQEWKEQTQGRLPLLIYGARQVGKTYEMQEFGSTSYKNMVYVNFETDERIGNYFEADIHADFIISILEKYYQTKIIPEDTLVIFDEIQMCERALTSLKYFAEEAPEYHIIAAGSLLGVALNHEKYSFPVGKVQMLTMYPMDLEEVLWAKGKQLLSDKIREHYESDIPLDPILHEEALQEFYHYCIVGGMPAAVKADIAVNSTINETEIRSMLLNSYIAEGESFNKTLFYLILSMARVSGGKNCFSGRSCQYQMNIFLCASGKECFLWRHICLLPNRLPRGIPIRSAIRSATLFWMLFLRWIPMAVWPVRRLSPQD